jgi:threonylcarbamoyladenosine tRNA methylthiotransferase MtaB
MYINLSEKKLRAFYEKHLGTQQSVLFESNNNSTTMSGFTTNYIKVETPHNEELVNEMREVTLKAILPNGHVAVDFAH